MKKTLYILASAALLTACSSNDTLKDIDTQESAIAFDQAINNTTRANIANNSVLAQEGGFIVYGYKKATSAAHISDHL